MTQFFSQVQQIFRIEAEFFLRFRKQFLATIVVTLIPAMYTLIYLSSLWDPASHTQALSVGLVNLDQDIEYQGQTFNMGKEVISRLKASHTFGFKDAADEMATRQAVREGKLAFALTIPADFSSNAVPGTKSGAGKLVVYTSEGNNFQSAQIARRFAGDLGHAVNDSLNERRWALVLTSAAGSQRNVERLRAGVDDLRMGIHTLEAGVVKVDDGASAVSKSASGVTTEVYKLTSGISQLGAGLRTMDTSLPKTTELNRLKNGATALVVGHLDLGQGLTELQAGSNRLKEGVGSFLAEAKESVFVPERVVVGLDQINVGATQLDTGLESASSAHRQLTDGSKILRTSITTLTDGVQSMSEGIHVMASKLPEDNKLKALTEGTDKLAKGAKALADGTQNVKTGTQHLSIGMDLIATSLFSTIQRIDGSAEGMARSVQPQVEVVASVPNQGNSFAPNVIPAALWLGASIIVFLIHVRVMPKQAEYFSNPAQLIGKVSVPGLIVLLQAFSILIAAKFLLGIEIIHLGAFITILTVASLTFLFFVFALTRALGDAGKALAMLFLAVQLTSSGGVLPVELSGGLFASISPWLPMTWVVKAIKASMFGAYDGAWHIPLLQITLVGIGAAVCASVWGRWRFVAPEDVRPAVDF